jgi:hypothetical protein
VIVLDIDLVLFVAVLVVDTVDPVDTVDTIGDDKHDDENWHSCCMLIRA